MPNSHFTKTYNKVVVAGDTLIDLSADTVTAASMRSGVTAHNANGASISGNIPDVTLSISNGSGTSGLTTSSSNTSGVYYKYGPVKTVGTGNVGYINYPTSGTQLAPENTQYITKVTLPKDKKIDVETTADTALDTTSDLTITNNAFRRMVVTNSGTELNTNTGGVTITNNSAGTVGISHNSTGQVSCMIHSGGSGDVSIGTDSTSYGDVFVQAFAADTGAATSGSQQIVTNGRWYTQEVTPTTSDSSPIYGKTIVKGDANLIAGNIKKDVSIFGVTGTLEGTVGVTYRNGGATWAQAVAASSTSVGWREEKYADGRLVRYAWDFWNANAGDGAKTVAMTATASDGNGPTAFVGTPEVYFFQRSTGSTAVSAAISLQSRSNTTHTYYMFFSNNGSNRRIAVSTKMEGRWQ